MEAGCIEEKDIPNEDQDAVKRLKFLQKICLVLYSLCLIGSIYREVLYLVSLFRL